MAKGSQNRQGKALRIGVLHKGRLVDERIVHDGVVRFGHELDNELVVFGTDIPDSKEIFVAQADGAWALKLDPASSSSVEIKGTTKSVSAWARDGVIALAADAQGKVLFEETTILFQMVDGALAVPVLPPSMKLGFLGFAALMLGLSTAFIVSLVVSFVIHGGIWGYGYFVPPPPRADGEFELNARLTRMLVDLEEQEREVVETEENPDDSIPEEQDDSTEEERPEPQDKPDEPTSGDPQDALTEIDQVIAASAFGALVSADGGLNLALVAADSASERSAAEALAMQQATGGVGTGVVAANLGGVGSGTGDGTGRLGVGDGGNAVADAARAGGGASQQEQVRVRPNVADRGNRTAGSGTLSESEVRGVLGRFARRVERCYERVLASNPSAAGRVEIQFRVNASGETEDARLPSNELGDSFGNCILTEVRRLRFSAPAGGSVTVSQRYILEPGR